MGCAATICDSAVNANGEIACNGLDNVSTRDHLVPGSDLGLYFDLLPGGNGGKNGRSRKRQASYSDDDRLGGRHDWRVTGRRRIHLSLRGRVFLHER